MLTSGRYYCYDNPQGLETEIEKKLNIHSSDYTLLYSVYSLPNTVLPVIGSYIIDFFGMKISIFVFSLLGLVGQSLVAYGGAEESFFIMIVGRAVFGLYGECCYVAQFALARKWFTDEEYAFALMLISSCHRVFSSTNSYFTPAIYNWTQSLFWPLFVGDSVMFATFLCTLVVILFEFRFEVNRQKHISKMKIKEQPREDEKPKLKDLFDFKLPFWIFLFSGMCYFGGFTTFTDIGNSYLQKKFNIDSSTAGLMLTILYASKVPTAPLFGKIIDLYNQRIIFNLLSIFWIMGGFIILIIIPNFDGWNAISLVPMALLGLSLSLYAATFYSAAPLIGDSGKAVMVYGLTLSTQNIFLLIIPWFTSYIYDSTKANYDYGLATVFLAGLVALGGGIILGLYLFSSKVREVNDKNYRIKTNVPELKERLEDSVSVLSAAHRNVDMSKNIDITHIHDVSGHLSRGSGSPKTHKSVISSVNSYIPF